MKSKKETIIKRYFVDKARPADIAKELNISKSAVTQVLQKDERYKVEKEYRKEKNKLKHNENTKIIVKKQREIKKFKNHADNLDMKRMHEQASKELSKGKRISNIAYRNWNKSAFTYNSKRKGYEFRKELGRSYDVPKFIKVEV